MNSEASPKVAATYEDRILSFCDCSDDTRRVFAETAVGDLPDRLLRTKIWSEALAEKYVDDPIAPLLSALQSMVLEFYVLAPLGLLVSAHMSLRSVLDLAVGISYYWAHPVELLAVAQQRAPWLGRARMLDWHQTYTPHFKEVGNSLGIIDTWESVYRSLSRYVHSLPGPTLPARSDLSRVSPGATQVDEVSDVAAAVDHAINILWLVVFPKQVSVLDAKDQRLILSGIERAKIAPLSIAES